jgi:hypothetical protein
MYNNCCVLVLQQCAAACVHLLNEQSHANHSFQLYIFDCSCTVIMYTIICRAAVLTAVRAAVRALLNKQTMPTIHSSCTSLLVAVQLSCTTNRAPGTTVSGCCMRALLKAEPCQPFIQPNDL